MQKALLAIASVFVNDNGSDQDSMTRDPDNISGSTTSSVRHVESGGDISNDDENRPGSPQQRVSVPREQGVRPFLENEGLEGKVSDGDDDAGQNQAEAATIAAARPAAIEDEAELTRNGGSCRGGRLVSERSGMNSSVCRLLERFRSESCADELLAPAERRNARGEHGNHCVIDGVSRSRSFDCSTAASLHRAPGMIEESWKKVSNLGTRK